MKPKPSLELQKFYTRKANRIVFSNGMSLNQLALEMWERLGFHDIDPSVLSRVLKGERRFTPQQLETLAQVLNLSSSEYINLQLDYCREILSETGLKENLIDSLIYQTEYIEQGLKKTEEARSYDSQSLAYLWITALDNLLKSKIDTSTDRKSKIKLYSLWGQVLRKKAWIILEYIPESQVIPEISKITVLFEKIAEITGDLQFRGYAQSYMGSIAFRQKKYRESLDHDAVALRFLQDHRIILNILNRTAINYSLLGEVDQTRVIEDQMEKHISLLNSDDYATPHFPLYEHLLLHRRIATAYIISKNAPLAQNHLDQGWKIYNRHLAVGEGNFKYRSKIVLYHTEDLFRHYFGAYHRHYDKLQAEVKTLVDLCGYNQYAVEGNHFLNSKLL